MVIYMNQLYNRIAVIDTGCNPNYLGKNNICGYSLVIRKEQVEKILNYDDRIGHGTAVICIIDQIVSNSQIVAIKIDEAYCKKYGVSKWLYAALKYIYENECFDVINLSLGCYESDAVNYIEEICVKINQKGTIIVSAFDNNGIMSYPASFHSVIGIDSSPLLGVGKYIYVDEVVNIVAGAKKWNLPKICNEYSKSYGNSFVCPEFAAQIYNWLLEGVRPEKIKDALKLNAQQVMEEHNRNIRTGNKVHIKRAITYPFSKEISVLARFEDMLDFEIYGYYDHPLLGKTNIDIGASFNCNNSHKIQSIYDLDWSDNFDTVILSHVDVLSQTLRTKIAEQFIEKCLLHKKNLFLFDENDRFGKYSYNELEGIFENNNLWIKKPVKNHTINSQWGGKLYNISCPILCIAGTDSSQGKFTLQVALRYFLKKQNIKVCNFGTEPSSELFGFEGVYTFGYNAYMPFEGWKNIIAINHALHQLENSSPDIIITGLQSRTIAPNVATFKSYPIKQQEFITACSPDTYVLCINVDDSRSYIKRTIRYLESIFPSKVIALCINDVSCKISLLRLIGVKIGYKLLFGRKVFCLSSEKSLCKLSKRIIRYYK